MSATGSQELAAAVAVLTPLEPAELVERQDVRSVEP